MGIQQAGVKLVGTTLAACIAVTALSGCSTKEDELKQRGFTVDSRSNYPGAGNDDYFVKVGSCIYMAMKVDKDWKFGEFHPHGEASDTDSEPLLTNVIASSPEFAHCFA